MPNYVEKKVKNIGTLTLNAKENCQNQCCIQWSLHNEKLLSLNTLKICLFYGRLPHLVMAAAKGESTRVGNCRWYNTLDRRASLPHRATSCQTGLGDVCLSDTHYRGEQQRFVIFWSLFFLSRIPTLGHMHFTLICSNELERNPVNRNQ